MIKRMDLKECNESRMLVKRSISLKLFMAVMFGEVFPQLHLRVGQGWKTRG